MHTAILRQRAEAAIERLIALLDAIDGDADLECNGDLEPSLGFGIALTHFGHWHYVTDDREGHDASDEPDANSNPQTMNPPPVRSKRLRRAA
jgi:hypothetical protein